jgi:hypothetical protein
MFTADGHGMYHRLDPRLPRKIDLDDVSAMTVLSSSLASQLN